MTSSRARALHLVVAAVAWTALVLQFVLVARGASVLDETNPPGFWLRIGRFFSYFTIQSNILVAVAATWLARDPRAEGRLFRAIRVAGLVGITITGVVYFFLLRPLLDLSGWNEVADDLLHVASPVLTVAAWLVLGPRGRIDGRAIRDAFVWPVLWLAWTLAIGAGTGWFPYPFLNWHHTSGIAVALTCVAIFGLAACLFAGARALDRRLPGQSE
jgi:hypothetical protein